MIETLDIATIVAQLGFAAVFFYLYTREREDRAKAQEQLVETLREIAGMRQTLMQNEAYMAGRLFQAGDDDKRRGDTKPLNPTIMRESD